jgi:hypothetical protein
MSNPSSVLKENDWHLQKATSEYRHPDFEGAYKEELECNLNSILKELHPQLKS